MTDEDIFDAPILIIVNDDYDDTLESFSEEHSLTEEEIQSVHDAFIAGRAARVRDWELRSPNATDLAFMQMSAEAIERAKLKIN